MTKDETAKILHILKVAYPAFYSKMRPADMVDTVSLWSTMFSEERFGVVQAAVYDLIQTHTGYPPEIADVKAKIREMISAATNEPTDEVLWQMLKRAVGNGYYGAKEEFEKLPPILKKFCGSPSWIREHAQVDISTLDTVTHGQFLRTIGNIRERESFNERMPEPIKQMIRASVHRLDEISSETGDKEFNNSRNKILNLLEYGVWE